MTTLAIDIGGTKLAAALIDNALAQFVSDAKCPRPPAKRPMR
ncbi:N-acetylmannosamine kinase [Lelliottia amnigena]|nr:N-acetylmannosamine kinase [Lelliottia amnigena]